MRYIFDTNIFNKIVDGDIAIEDVLNTHKKNRIEYFATHIQIDELNNCKDPKKRNKLIKTFNLINKTTIPTESLILGVSKLGMAKLGGSSVLEAIRVGNIKKTKDALIGETAIKQNLCLVTEDKALLKKMKKISGEVLSLAEFKEVLSKQK